MRKADIFFKEIKGKRIAFIGTGVTNTNIIRLFLTKGFDVTICDRKTAEDMGSLYGELASLGAKYRLGANYLDSLTDFDVVFRSPGMYFNHEKLVEARKKGVFVTSEMEVFFEICPCKIYAVTGSDGKTTTTTLISEMLLRQGKNVHKGGNIGRALLPIVEDMSEDDVAVVELSSFQLISMRHSPNTAVITNISPNHLDVHGTMEEYIDAKKNLILHQSAFSRTVLNADNAETIALSDLVRGIKLTFSRFEIPDFGAFLNSDGVICFNEYGKITEIMEASDIKIPGIHNVENYLAAISAIWGEVDIDVIKTVAKTFGGVEHRIEYVRTVNGVKYYNDSIATSPTRVLAGLNSFTQKLIVIAGGYDKKIPFEPMADTICSNVKHLILLGATADKIEAAVKGSTQYNEEALQIHRADSMENAVKIAYEIAAEGDIVTLSPACASFDSYPNFEARGIHYKNLVEGL